MIRISIDSKQKPYEALIEQGILRSAGMYIRELLPDSKRVFTITVPRVRKHHAKALTASLRDVKIENHFIEMPDGERFKHMGTVEALASKLVKLGADRESTLVALGGGVVGDVTGFLAAIYMRGVKFVQIPTTFLSQIDSSVGAKTGVNLKEGKNLVGIFNQPEMVLIDPDVLLTLPAREFRSGLYEALKTGVIREARIFDFMESNHDRILKRDSAAMEWLIGECVRVKAGVVSADERERGLRRILNFGHTVGHALESETKYKHFLHGEAVAWGMIAAGLIALETKHTDRDTLERMVAAIKSYGRLPKVDVKARGVIRLLTRDKKTVNGKVHFVLPVKIGEVEVVADVPERAVMKAVDELRKM